METFTVPVHLHKGEWTRRVAAPVSGWAVFRIRDGYLLKFIDSDGTTKPLEEANVSVRHVAEYGFEVDWDQWQQMHQHWNWASESEKFSNFFAQELWDASLDSGQDETLGESDTFGWFALFKSDHAILHTGSQGFVSVDVLDSEQEAVEKWAKIEAEYDKWSAENDDEG